jgi:DNA-binding transcriptional ArsR family regulator
MEPEEHYQYFETLFARNRAAILSTLKDDKWLREGRVVVQFGEGVRGIADKVRMIRIPLSDIYRSACELQSKAEAALDGVAEEIASVAGGKDLIRPRIVLLHLLRLLYHLTEGPDHTTLGSMVFDLETELGVSRKTVEPGTTPTGGATGKGGGLEGLFSMATTMMERMGMKPPEGMKPPTENEISSVIETVFNNEATQSAIQGMFGSLQGCNDIGSMMQTVMSNMGDPSTMGALQQSVSATMQEAAQAIGPLATEPSLSELSLDEIPLPPLVPEESIASLD